MLARTMILKRRLGQVHNELRRIVYRGTDLWTLTFNVEPSNYGRKIAAYIFCKGSAAELTTNMIGTQRVQRDNQLLNGREW